MSIKAAARMTAARSQRIGRSESGMASLHRP
jgi:hypothetical protein